MTSGFQGGRTITHQKTHRCEEHPQSGGIILAKSSLSEFARGTGDNINSVIPVTREIPITLPSQPFIGGQWRRRGREFRRGGRRNRHAWLHSHAVSVQCIGRSSLDRRSRIAHRHRASQFRAGHGRSHGPQRRRPGNPPRCHRRWRSTGSVTERAQTHIAPTYTSALDKSAHRGAAWRTASNLQARSHRSACDRAFPRHAR